jgi:hypothetical protein
VTLGVFVSVTLAVEVAVGGVPVVVGPVLAVAVNVKVGMGVAVGNPVWLSFSRAMVVYGLIE